MSQQIRIERLPRTVEEFVAWRDGVAGTPEGGAAAMVVALHAFAADEALGRQCLTVAVDAGHLADGPDGYKGKTLGKPALSSLKGRVGGKPFMLRSYFEGTSPEKGYALPEGGLAISVSDNPYSGDKASGTYKVFVACAGASQARPVTLKRNDKGLWKAHEWSSLTLGVVPPKQVASDDL